jgi:hypothetical protein
MKLKMGLRIVLAAALAWAALGSAGCGQMARDAIKTGTFTYLTDASNAFNLGEAFGQLESLVTGSLSGGGLSSLFQ